MDDLLDPAEVASLEDLAECLHQLHVRADSPTFRALEQQTVHASRLLPGTQLERVRLGRSTLSAVLLGRKFPRKAFLLTFVAACGVNLENDRRWEQAWDRLAVQHRQQNSPTPGEVERLRPENEDLHQQLAAATADVAVLSAQERFVRTIAIYPRTYEGCREVGTSAAVYGTVLAGGRAGSAHCSPAHFCGSRFAGSPSQRVAVKKPMRAWPSALR